MSLNLKRRLTNWWLTAVYDLNKTSYWLYLFYPIHLIIRYIVGHRLKKQAKYYSPILNYTPVWIVGNLTIGGTGKTPSIIAIANLLTQHGIKVAVVSRGYGSATKHNPHLVTATDLAIEVGDEAKLMQQAGLTICIGSNRLSTAKLLLQQTKCDLILSDDGLQHYALPRTLEIVLLDRQKLFGNEKILPLGPLREPIKRLAEADSILINYKFNQVKTNDRYHSPYNKPQFNIHFTSLYVCNLKSGNKMQLSQWINAYKNGSIHLIAAIADPTSFFNILDKCNLTYTPHIFIDHHQYTYKDFIDFTATDILLMTQKDAVKCHNLDIQPETWYLAIEVQLPQDLCMWLKQQARKQIQQKYLLLKQQNRTNKSHS